MMKKTILMALLVLAVSIAFLPPSVYAKNWLDRDCVKINGEWYTYFNGVQKTPDTYASFELVNLDTSTILSDPTSLTFNADSIDVTTGLTVTNFTFGAPAVELPGLGGLLGQANFNFDLGVAEFTITDTPTSRFTFTDGSFAINSVTGAFQYGVDEVPEPATVVMGLLGLVPGIWIYARRKLF